MWSKDLGLYDDLGARILESPELDGERMTQKNGINRCTTSKDHNYVVGVSLTCATR